MTDGAILLFCKPSRSVPTNPRQNALIQPGEVPSNNQNRFDLGSVLTQAAANIAQWSHNLFQGQQQTRTMQSPEQTGSTTRAIENQPDNIEGPRRTRSANRPTEQLVRPSQISSRSQSLGNTPANTTDKQLKGNTIRLSRQSSVESLPDELIRRSSSFLSNRSESESSLSDQSNLGLASSELAKNRFADVEKIEVTPENIRKIIRNIGTRKSLLDKSRTPNLDRITISGNVEPREVRRLLAAISNRDSISEISFKNCENLYTISNRFPLQLKKLTFDGCTNLLALPHDFPDGLNHLGINNCQRLVNLSPQWSNQLQTLTVSNCQSFQSIVSQLPSQLNSLIIKDCENFTEPPQQLPNELNRIEIKHCRRVRSLSTQWPSELKILDVSNCHSLESIDNPLPSKLEVFTAQQCHNLTLNINQLTPSITNLDLSYCYQLGAVNNARGHPVAFEPLEWHTLPNLRELNLTGSLYAHHLASVPNQLEVLNISRLPHVQVDGPVPESLQIIAIDCEEINIEGAELNEDQFIWYQNQMPPTD